MPPQRLARDGLGRLETQVALDAALHDPVDDLVARAVLLMPVQAALQPAVRALGRARRVIASDVEGRAFVEHERDVRMQRGLHRHRSLGRHEALVAVDVGAEADALLCDREDGAVRRAAGGAAGRVP